MFYLLPSLIFANIFLFITLYPPPPLFFLQLIENMKFVNGEAFAGGAISVGRSTKATLRYGEAMVRGS